MTINERIAEIRKRSKLTQTAFGQRIGASRDTIANLEGGRSSISSMQKTSICREFNVNPDWLENEEGEMYLLPLEEEAALFAEMKKIGSTATIEVMKAIAHMYVGLSVEERRSLDEAIREAVLATKKDPE